MRRSAGRHAGNQVLQQRLERGPGLDPGIPILGALKVIPRHIAEIIDARQMGGGGYIGIGDFRPSEPIAPLGEIFDIFQVLLDVDRGTADIAGLGHTKFQETFHDLFGDQQDGDFFVELDIEPVNQPTDFGPVLRVSPEQGAVGICFFQMFPDGIGTGQGLAVFQGQDRHRARRIKRQKIPPPHPRQFQHQLKSNVLLQ